MKTPADLKHLEKEPEDGCAGSLLVIPIAFIGVLLSGAVLMKLWQWFVEPLGAPTIGFAHAVGLALIGNVVTTKIDMSDKTYSYSAMKRSVLFLGVKLLWSVIVLLEGWILSGWV